MVEEEGGVLCVKEEKGFGSYKTWVCNGDLPWKKAEFVM